MKRVDVKGVLVCGLALLSANVEVAGVYPLVPAVFMIGFMIGVNRSLLLLASIAGLLIFVPVVSMIKYSLALLAAVLIIKGIEWYYQRCTSIVAALVAGICTLAVGQLCAMMHLKDAANIAISLLEAVFIVGIVYLLVRFGYLFMQWEPHRPATPQILVGGSKRLEYYAESFLQLSKTFGQMHRYKEDFTAEELSRMQSEVTGRVCASCVQCSVCWEQENPPMYQVLYRFLQKLKSGYVTETSASELKQHCLYSTELINHIMQIFEKARLNMAWYNRLQENREVIAQQLDAMAYIMEDCARENVDISRQEGKFLANVKYYCREKGIAISQIKMMQNANEKKILLLQCKAKQQHCIPVREMAKQFSTFGSERFVTVPDNPVLLGSEDVLLTFVEDCRYMVYHGIARMVKEGEQLSGDNFSFLTLRDGRFVMSLSDGMGSGAVACKESETVIDLLEKFLEAGFYPDASIRMMNSAMVTHGENNLFSTVDVADIQLDTGKCQLYKVGAAPTFVKHGSHVARIACENPPIGLFSKMEIQTADVTLKHGDFIVMVSDGVLDYLHVDQPEETLKEILNTIDTTNAKQMARQILEYILVYTGGTVRDDMTVLVAGIWEKDR